MDWNALPAAVVAVLLAVAAYIRSRSTKQAIARVEVAVNSNLHDALGDVSALADYVKANRKPGDPEPPALSADRPPTP